MAKILMEKRHIFENVGFVFKIDQENESVELLEAARYGSELLDESDIQQMIFMFSNGKSLALKPKIEQLFSIKIKSLFMNVLLAH